MPRLWHRVRELMRTVFRSKRVNRDLDDELADWVETIAARHRARGVPDEEARRLAALELGGVAQVKEEAVAVRNGAELDSTVLDVKYAVRALRRAPGFSAAAIVTFALGIGATTAIFSVVKAILIEPLPYPDADRLAFVWSDATDLGYPHAPLSGPEIAEFQQRATSFERLGGIWATNTTLAGHGDPEQLRIATVTPDFFPLLGVSAALGRVLGPEDFGQTVTPVLLSHALWSRSFGADRAAVGRKITLNDRPAVVAGVMPPDFELLFPADAAVPTDLQAWIPGSARLATQPRGQQYLRVVGRLKDGAGMSAAIEEVATIGASIMAANPGAYTPGWRFYGVGMKEDTVRPVRPAMLAVFGGVLILLVIACVNIAGLLIVRASARQRETSMRVALGASGSRLLRQCLVEGLLLAIAGGALGVAVSHAGLKALVQLAPSTLPRMQAADLDLGVLAFAAGTAVVWGLAFSLVPWFEVRRVDLVSALQHGGRLTPDHATARLRAVLVVAQIAMGAVLMVGAALLARTFHELTRLDPGFRTEQTLTFRVAPPFQRYRPQDGQNLFHQTLVERLRALPGVTGAGSVSHLPYDNLPNWATPYLPMDETDTTKSGLADTRTVSPGFFEALAATLLMGRPFAENEGLPADMPVIVDELLARRLSGSANPLHQRFKVDLGGTGQMAPMEIVGVVRHLRHRNLLEGGREQLFVPARLWPRNPASYVVRTSGDPNAIVAGVRDAVRAVDPALPIYDVRLLDDYVGAARAPSRFTMAIAVTFACVALVLACVGVYGVIAYAVGQRKQEFGIRRVLGAETGAIVRLVLADAVRIGAAGLAVGGLAALGLAHLMDSLLFGIEPTDPLAFVAAIGTPALAVLTASWLPARRAATAPPMDILRTDA
jgi:predicted permease